MELLHLSIKVLVHAVKDPKRRAPEVPELDCATKKRSTVRLYLIYGSDVTSCQCFNGTHQRRLKEKLVIR
jgi:hypothetical protein